MSDPDLILDVYEGEFAADTELRALTERLATFDEPELDLAAEAEVEALLRRVRRGRRPIRLSPEVEALLRFRLCHCT